MGNFSGTNDEVIEDISLAFALGRRVTIGIAQEVWDRKRTKGAPSPRLAVVNLSRQIHFFFFSKSVSGRESHVNPNIRAAIPRGAKGNETSVSAAPICYC